MRHDIYVKDSEYEKLDLRENKMRNQGRLIFIEKENKQKGVEEGQ